MACMTHECLDCKKTIFNNEPRAACPECKRWMISSFDEEPEKESEEDDGN